MSARITFAIGVLLFLGLPTCGGGPPDAAKVYSSAGEKMLALASYHLTQEVRPTDELSTGRLEIDIVPPDKVQIIFTLTEEGVTEEMSWIAVGDQWYFSPTQSPDYFVFTEEEAGDIPDYLAFATALYTQATDLTYVGEDALDGVPTHHLQGILSLDVLELVEPTARHTEAVRAEIWVGVDDSLVRRYRLTETDQITTLTFSRFDEAISIVEPADARPGEEIWQLPGDRVLGLRCSYASKYLREKYGLPDRQGCVILRVTKGGAAEAAGLAEGQLIVALESVPITSGPQFTRFFESLDKRKQEYTALRPGEKEPFTTIVTLGAPGELADFDANDPYFFYLRGRGADDRAQAILDLTKAIELAPDFDLAYIYRAAYHVENMMLDDALADLNHALELDDRNAEAFRWRAEAYRYNGEYEAALADADTAIELDKCPDAFRTYNYDCFVNHMIRLNTFGMRGGPGDSERAVPEAQAAIEFYPELADPYYLAAYHLSLLGAEERARDYATQFLELSKDDVTYQSQRDWAQRLVSGSPYSDEPEAFPSEPERLFVERDTSGDLVPDGAPALSALAFSEERSFSQAPAYVRSLSNGLPQLWAYFHFDNAAAVETIRWEWYQNLAITDFGEEPWPGTNEGEAWLALDNALPGINTRSSLTVMFDGEVVATTDISLLGDSFLTPATFYEDAAATRPILFYSGEPNPVYAAMDYAGVLPGSTIPWVAELDGAQVATGDTVLASNEGRVIVPIGFPPDLEPGVITIYFYLHNEPARTAWLVLAPSEVVQPPPFERLKIGLEPDLEGGLALQTNVFQAGVPQIDYVLEGVNFGPDSVLSIQWYREGKPVWPLPETFGPGETFRGANLSFGEDVEAGEYQLLVSWDGVPVYAAVVVVE